jgi:S1-C subfamily serine protease
MNSPLSRILSLGLTAILPVTAAEGPLRDHAIALAEAHRDSVVFLTALVEMEVSLGEEGPTKKEERKMEALGTVIAKDGLIAAPLSTLDVASNVDGRTVNSPRGAVKISAKGTTKEIKILMQDGSEIPATLVAKDPDLDLAFIRPENKDDAAKLNAIDIADHAPIALLEDVILLGRLGKELNREAVVHTTEIISIVHKPRTFAKIGAHALGTPIFNREGKFLGLAVNRFSSKSDTDNQSPAASSVLLPAEDLIDSASQAK